MRSRLLSWIMLFTLVISVDYIYAQNLETIKRNAEQGKATAQYSLGIRYLQGDGVLEDPQKAFEWISRAAEQGVPEAQGYLGTFAYALGVGVEKNDENAFEWTKKAAKQGDVASLCKLGIMYHKGLGVPQNHEKAFEWLSKAASTIEIMSIMGNPLPPTWREVPYSLGVMYIRGMGVPKDDEKGFYWMSQAAANEIVEAQSYLGVMYMEGIGILRDDQKAVEYFTKAANRGDVRAQTNLAAMYFEGRGILQNELEAYAWAIIAAANNSRNMLDILQADQKYQGLRQQAQRRAQEIHTQIRSH